MGQGYDAHVTVFNPAENFGKHAMTNNTQKNTVAIIGSHPRTRTMFDFARHDADVWIFNEAFTDPTGWAKRADAVFQMHAPAIWKSPRNQNDPKHFEWLRTQTAVPVVYMQEAYPEVPAAVAYPLRAVTENLLANFTRKKFFTSSLSYAIALAIHNGYRRIEIYGAEMETDTEYRYQRDAVAFWTGVAVGRGVEVYSPIAMFDAPALYGYEGDTKLDIETYRRDADELRPLADETRNAYAAARAAVQNMIDGWDGAKESGDKIVQAVTELTQIAERFGMVDGALQETEKYIAKCEAMTAEAGDYAIVRQEYEISGAGANKQMAVINNEAIAAATRLESIMSAAVTYNAIKRAKIMQTQFTPALGEFVKHCAMIGVCKGVASINQAYAAQLDNLIRMAGGAKAQAVLNAEV
jgi:hypothetical protein